MVADNEIASSRTEAADMSLPRASRIAPLVAPGRNGAEKADYTETGSVSLGTALGQGVAQGFMSKQRVLVEHLTLI